MQSSCQLCSGSKYIFFFVAIDNAGIHTVCDLVRIYWVTSVLDQYSMTSPIKKKNAHWHLYRDTCFICSFISHNGFIGIFYWFCWQIMLENTKQLEYRRGIWFINMIRYSNSLIFNGRYLIMSCSFLIPTCKYLLSNILPWKLQLGLISFGSSLHLFQLLINPCLWGFWQKHFCPFFGCISWIYIYIYIRLARLKTFS